MVEYQKILSRKELNQMKIKELEGVGRQLKLIRRPLKSNSEEKTMIITKILNYYRKEYNRSNLFVKYAQKKKVKKDVSNN